MISREFVILSRRSVGLISPCVGLISPCDDSTKTWRDYSPSSANMFLSWRRKNNKKNITRKQKRKILNQSDF